MALHFVLLQFVICHMSHPDPMMTTYDDLWKVTSEVSHQSKQGTGGCDRAGERDIEGEGSQREAVQRSVLEASDQRERAHARELATECKKSVFCKL